MGSDICWEMSDERISKLTETSMHFPKLKCKEEKGIRKTEQNIRNVGAIIIIVIYVP